MGEPTRWLIVVVVAVVASGCSYALYEGWFERAPPGLVAAAAAAAEVVEEVAFGTTKYRVTCEVHD